MSLSYLESTMKQRVAWAVLILGLCAIPTLAGDWLHWRGPEQNGVSKETGLPDTFSVGEVGKNNLIWKKPIGGRSAPLIYKGNLYLITASGSGLTEGERVVCMSETTGELVWEKAFNVFHTDIVSSRLGWTSLTIDPVAGSVFCHGTQGHVYCFDAKTGAVKWLRNLTEEFGRVTGYGGRIVSPIYDSGLVIVGMINSSWGNHARAANRFVAFDSTTGEVVWWAESPYAIRGTYYSNPVVSVINGQRTLITSGGDGYAHAFKVRTGERLWSYRFSEGVANPSPVVDGNLVYAAHGEENPGGGPIGKIVCLDASKVDAKTKQPKLVWETKKIQLANGTTRQGIRFGLASPAIADGILYAPDDAGELYAFDAKTGKGLWTYKYGTVSRGAPLVVDGKLYIFDVNAKLSVLKLNGQDEPQELEVLPFRSVQGQGFVETHGTPVAVNGRLFFCTREFMYCIGKGDSKPTTPVYKPLAAEPALAEDAAPTAIRIVPAEVTSAPGKVVEFRVEFLDANGRTVKAPEGAKIEWAIPTPPVPMGATAGPPALNGEIKADGAKAIVTVGKLPSQQGYVSAKLGTIVAPMARVRVAPQLPISVDFEKTPEGVAPGGWVNANGKYVVKKLDDGNKVLSKINNDSRPPIARAYSYITLPTSTGYSIECDVQASMVRSKMPDMGIVNSRYLLVMDGKDDTEFANERTLRIISWEARPRINKGVAFPWKEKVWYRMKFVIDMEGKEAILRGKVWDKATPEPEAWTVEFRDPAPNTEGAAALYGYVTNMLVTEDKTLPGSEIFYDNLLVKPNAKK